MLDEKKVYNDEKMVKYLGSSPDIASPKNKQISSLHALLRSVRAFVCMCLCNYSHKLHTAGGFKLS